MTLCNSLASDHSKIASDDKFMVNLKHSYPSIHPFCNFLRIFNYILRWDNLVPTDIEQASQPMACEMPMVVQPIYFGTHESKDKFALKFIQFNIEQIMFAS